MDKHPANQAVQKSKLLPLARAIDESLAHCIATQQREGTIQDADPVAERLMTLRYRLASSKPKNAVDALVMVANMQAVTAALARSDLEEMGPFAIKLGIGELCKALVGLKGYLEREGGVTAEALGLNPDGTRWQ